MKGDIVMPKVIEPEPSGEPEPVAYMDKIRAGLMWAGVVLLAVGIVALVLYGAIVGG